MLNRVGLIAAAVLLVSTVSALAVPDRAESLYAEGRYLQAANAALESGSVDASRLAFAARSRLAALSVNPTRRDADDILRQAEDEARRAIAGDPALIEGHLQLAIVLGFKGRRAGPMAAHLSGMANEARAAIDAALALDPKNPWARAIEGAWHLEIVSRAGSGLARAFYGASSADGMAAFEAARQEAPGNLLFDVQYAVALLALDPRAHREQAKGLLTAACEKPHANALETHLRETATRLKEALAGSGTGAVQALIAEIQGLPTPSDDWDDDLRD